MCAKQDKENPEQVVFAAAIRGTRDEQQDSFRVRWLEAEHAWLLVLADGMGGHAAGSLASKIAADSFVTSFEALRQQGCKLKDALCGAIDAVNKNLAQAQGADADTADMGTTLIGGHLSSRGIAWISVGDSPMWLYRKGSIHRLNEDHSLRGMRGIVEGSPNMLQSALTGQPIPLVDCHPEPVGLNAGDLILICSDGLLTLSEDLVASTIEKAATANPQLLTWLLLHAVEDRQQAKQDNCSLIIARSLPSRKSRRLVLSTLTTDFKVASAALGIGATLIAAGLLWIFR
jgi:PPM family protein phosphatase